MKLLRHENFAKLHFAFVRRLYRIKFIFLDCSRRTADSFFVGGGRGRGDMVDGGGVMIVGRVGEFWGGDENIGETGSNRRKNCLLRRVRRPEPSTLTIYCRDPWFQPLCQIGPIVWDSSICHLAGVVVVVESELLMILQFGGIVSSELLPPARPLSKLDGWRL